MNIKNLWMVLAIALVSLCTIGCSGDDDDDSSQKGDNNGNTTEVLTDYTVTTSIKTIVLEKEFDNYIYLVETGYKYTFYEDYNNSYKIVLWRGQIAVSHLIRSGGGWSNYYHVDTSQCGIIDIGKISSITSISTKNFVGGEGLPDWRGGYCYYSIMFQPQHGYAVMFTTEDGEQKYMRIYAKDYSLNSQGVLESVIIQYQLY